LVFRSAEDAQPAWWTCALLTLSALTTLGTLYQLIAQVAGLALLAGCVTVLLRIPHDLDRVAAARYGFLAALLVSALLVVYPEIFPFLVLAFLAHLAVTWRRWLAAPRPQLLILGTAAASCLLLLNVYAVSPLYFLVVQVNHGVWAPILSEIFPYFLIPSGLASFWGLVPLGGDLPADPWGSLLIILGALLLLGSCAGALWMARRAHPAALMTLVLLGLAVWLFCQPHGFGPFQLAMFIQPLLLPTL